MGQSSKNTIHRNDWAFNNSLITQATLTYYRDNQRRPTQNDLVKLTGLSRSTITRHYQHIDSNKVFQTERQHLQLLAGGLFDAIFLSAINGNSRSQVLALQLAFDWSLPKKSMNQETDEPVSAPEALEEMDDTIAKMIKYRDDVKRLECTNTI